MSCEVAIPLLILLGVAGVIRGFLEYGFLQGYYMKMAVVKDNVADFYERSGVDDGRVSGFEKEQLFQLLGRGYRRFRDAELTKLGDALRVRMMVDYSLAIVWIAGLVWAPNLKCF